MDSFEFSSTSPDMMSTTSNSTDASFNITRGGSKKNDSNVIEKVNLVLLCILVSVLFIHIIMSNISSKGTFWYLFTTKLEKQDVQRFQQGNVKI